jgi:hypothetical protein
VIELFGSAIDDKLSHDVAVLSGGPGIIIATRTAHDPASAIFISTFLRSSDAGHRHGTHWHEGSADLIQLSQALSANSASLAPTQEEHFLISIASPDLHARRLSRLDSCHIGFA